MKGKEVIQEGLPVLRLAATSPCLSYARGFLSSREAWGSDFSLASGWISGPYEGSVNKKERGKHEYWVSCWHYLPQTYTTTAPRILLIDTLNF